jgi:hypothetical protein
LVICLVGQSPADRSQIGADPDWYGCEKADDAGFLGKCGRAAGHAQTKRFTVHLVGSIWNSTSPFFTGTFGLTGIATICPVTFGVTSTTRPATVTRPDGVR